MKYNSSSKQNNTTYQHIQFMFTSLPIKAVYLIHTQSNKLYSKYLQNFCHYKNSCYVHYLQQIKSLLYLKKQQHTFAFIDENIDITHFTTGVRFQADVRNDTKSLQWPLFHRLSPWFGPGQSTQSSYLKNVSHSWNMSMAVPLKGNSSPYNPFFPSCFSFFFFFYQCESNGIAVFLL